jgi:hypothetical protein
MKLVAATPPKQTPVAPVKLLPLIVRIIPPAALPVVNDRLLTAGADGIA